MIGQAERNLSIVTKGEDVVTVKHRRRRMAAEAINPSRVRKIKTIAALTDVSVESRPKIGTYGSFRCGGSDSEPT